MKEGPIPGELEVFMPVQIVFAAGLGAYCVGRLAYEGWRWWRGK